MKQYFSILFFIIISFIAFAQTDTLINGKRYKIVDEKKADGASKKKYFPLDSIFVIDNKKFKYFNNWLTVGGGWQQNLTYDRPLGFTGGLDFNFHIKQHYFQAGTNITGVKFGFYNNYQLHLGYGKRFEDRAIHAAGFVGLSYSSGRKKIDSVYIQPFSEPGIYLQGEVVVKITYDVGIGVSLFADMNQEQSMMGLRFILYFSGAYKGKKNNQI
ncbi:MAG: hypothetical protein ACT4ON_07340 [Bacteroidota bacterium]